MSVARPPSVILALAFSCGACFPDPPKVSDEDEMASGDVSEVGDVLSQDSRGQILGYPMPRTK